MEDTLDTICTLWGQIGKDGYTLKQDAEAALRILVWLTQDGNRSWDIDESYDTYHGCIIKVCTDIIHSAL
jgi:hypothetical protein